uniref:von Willebrand factor type A domain-containing protein n=1 Tax=Candidatus Kentrum sp. MB TaxID=2138164 RepID=A0A450XPP3_9GAMM|nr:MAG: von Willebrand factor type A domain-containing protein [Candidatus Kentron sp. MB]VFK75427.1 MAG: von Willebrand factor type A domain-containing protein [Candidatus Kentron sp. MB]
MDFFLLGLLCFLLLWVAVGYALFFFGTGNSVRNSPVIRRTASHKLALVGERIEVSLSCAAIGIPPAPTTEHPRWDIVLLIDHSGSMGDGPGSALDEARKAAINLIETTPRGFRFAIVAFDDTSLCVCPMSPRGRGLLRAIREIHSGGGTDIALGLRNAASSMPPKEGTEKQAVILLSDGGSAAEPALAAAEQIKADGVLLITIGFDAADMGLLRAIASSPEQCYEIDNLEELTALYTEIGSKMVGAGLSNVRVAEFLNAKGWGVRGWGDIDPVERRLAAGEFAWRFSTLEERPTVLSYTIEAHCPGWRRIAHQNAQLTALHPDGKQFEAESNRNPYVLVLPGIPGWQLLWLILNPLFFLTFGRFFCHEQKFTSIAPNKEALFPQPFDLPAPLAASPPMAADLSIPPILMIGVGYGGIHAITHAKRLLWERDRDRLTEEKVRFLGIDTASERFFPSPKVGSISLDADERFSLQAALEPVVRSEAIGKTTRYPWLPAKNLVAGAARPALLRGAGHERSLGRLALLESREEMAGQLRQRIKQLADSADQEPLQVLIVGTSGGGTSSGVVADLCGAVRRELNQAGLKGAGISLFLMAPFHGTDEGADKRLSRQRLCNHQALFLELERLCVLRGQPLAPDANGKKITAGFDRLLLVGSHRQQDIDNHLNLYPKTGETLFCWLASAAFRAHFEQMDQTGAAITDTHGFGVGHRLEPASRYLYPRTLREWLSQEALLYSLATRVWDRRETGDTEQAFMLDTQSGEHGQKLRNSLLHSPNWAGEMPWLFSNLHSLQEENTLYGLLQSGGGPTISERVGHVERADFIRRQRGLMETTLDTWVTDTLNGQIPEGPESSGLYVLYQAFHAIGDMCQQAVAALDGLDRQTQMQLVQEEISVIRDLVAQTIAGISAWRGQLEQWGLIFGEGKQSVTLEKGAINTFDGLMHHMRRTAAHLRENLEQTRHYTSPALAITHAQVKEIRQRFQPNVDDIFARFAWRVSRDGVRPSLILKIQSISVHEFKIGEISNTRSVAEIVRGLSAVLRELQYPLVKDLDTVCLADFPGGEELRAPEPPRLDGLSSGAHGAYLIQGDNLAISRTSAETIPLKPLDGKEERLISVENNLSLLDAWKLEPCAAFPPFIHIEEYNAYRCYHAYCHIHKQEPDHLDARIVALFTDINTIINFAIHGLANGNIATSEYAGQPAWIDRNLSAENNFLARVEDNGIRDFFSVAQAWITRCREQNFQEIEITQDDLQKIPLWEKAIIDHQLVREMDGVIAKQFSQVVIGALVS